MASSQPESTSTGGSQANAWTAYTGPSTGPQPDVGIKPRMPDGATGDALPPSDSPVDLPMVPPGTDLAPPRLRFLWLLLCFAATFLVYVALVPRFLLYASPPTGDQPFYLMDAISLVQDGDLNVANNYAQVDEDKFYELAPRSPDFVGMGAPYPLPPQLAPTPARPDEEWYGSHLPGLSILLVPAWIVGSWFSLWWPATVVFMCLIGALLGTNVFLLAHELTGRVWVAVVVWLTVSFGNPIMSYSYLIFTEMPTGLLLLYAFRRLAMGWAANGPGRLLLIGACIAYIPWMAWRCVPVAAALGLYALVQWFRHRRLTQIAGDTAAADSAYNGAAPTTAPSTRPTSLGTLALLAAPVAVSAALVVWYSLFIYGTIVPAGGGSLVRNQRALFNWPWDGLDAFSRYLNGVFGLLFDRQMGLLIYAPVYLLAVVGAIAIFMLGRRSDRRLLGWIAAVTLPYMAVLAAFEWWNGVWSPPARYWATFVPLFAVPLAMSLVLIRGWLYKVVYALLALPGFALMAVMMDDPRQLFPHERGVMFDWLANSPQSPLRVDLRQVLPYFTPPDDRTHLATTGWAIAAALAILLLCYMLVLRQRRARAVAGWARGRHLSVWLGVVAVVASGWLVMNVDYFRPKTVLTEVARWRLDPPPDQPRGMGFHDGKLYITGYESRSLTALDLQSGESSPVVPVSAGEPLTYTHPGAVELGSDDLLYLLNNGEGPEALFAMQPGGEVVRQIPLEGKGPIAVGLDFGPDGSLYVSNMTGGQVLKYAPEGGEPHAAWRGMTEGFNNVAGIVVDEQGTVYAAEQSENRIQVIDGSGSFVRSYDFRCSPMFIARDGDWLDVSCGDRLLSINKVNHETRSAQLSGEGELPSAPTGLAYGPDGTLYVVSNDTVLAYSVQR